jgi:2-octaprenyl-6-methoxyphenol hydroxylase
LIAGAGPVGLTTALALHTIGLAPLVLDARPDTSTGDDPRAIALSHGSRLILARLGAWDRIEATPICTIIVSQERGFGRARIEAADHGIDALGHVTRLAGLTAALRDIVASRGIEVRHGSVVGAATTTPHGVQVEVNGESLECALLVRAEGTPGEDAELKDYGQSAVVTEAWANGLREGRAWERFTPEGPLALLPLGDGFSVVWCMRPERAAAVEAMTDGEFLAAFSAATRFAPYHWLRTGARRTYRLALARRALHGGAREIRLGNAAQTLHPVAGQGLNLGLRDAFELSLALRDGISAPAIDGWRERRGVDRDATVRATDLYVSLFSNELTPLRIARGLGLALVDSVPSLRSLVARRMMFGTR